jgi:predicted lipoprotein with Yx(FWY)xxD motif
MERKHARPTAVLALGALVAAILAAALMGIWSGMSGAGVSTRQAVVKSARNSALKETILVNRRGMTLYQLSVEKHGKFICTSSCLSLWHPLVVKRGVTPAGAKSLGLVKRPDGRLQVTYKGGPLYTFVQDRKPGDVSGNGFKDVGIWRPAALGAASSSASPPVGTGGGYGGGYGR